MKATELKTKSQTELKALLVSLLEEQFQLRMQKGVAESPKTHRFKAVRREIARVKTILNQQAAA